MIKRFFKITTVALLFGTWNYTATAQCKSKSIIKACKANLAPYLFSGAADNDLIIDNNPHTHEVEFTAYADQKYRLIFCSSGNFSEKVTVNIYDKRKTMKTRQRVYNSDSGIDNLFWVFEPKKSGNYYIEYEVPVSNDGKVKQGCMVVLIGYKDL